ncbi:MAG: Ribonuclease [Candidatus Parcubacteria bacterium]|jgi:ribonuclease P protein component
MLPKMKRLTKEDFKGARPKVFFRGVICDIAHIESENQKFACVISKKKIKKAAARNAIKRKVYHSLEAIQPQVKGLFIIYPKSIPKITPYSHIHDEIMRAFATLH